ncbi:hypothetical protein C0585_00215 [Candidatus Woesearchaeota archaeon]|nr:MAG: hypothetical protein C0585_00215 [Candidatus Woesearchaeota archaeon]
MLFAGILKKDAQSLKKYLLDCGLFDKCGKHFIEGEKIYFPIKKKFNFELDIDFIERDVEIEESKDFKTILQEKLTDEELSHLKTAYDQVGNIAILEIDDELKEKEKFIAETLLKTNKTAKTVVKKAGIHGGVFRTQEMEHVAGENTKESITKENGITLKINVEEVYYSPRLSTDRKRISEQVKKGERVLAMFSGAAPYPCTISKNTFAKDVVGIEINPEGHKLGVNNIRLNKCDNVKLINGDVNEIIPELNKYLIGTKSGTSKNALDNRIKSGCKLIELYLAPGEIDDSLDSVQTAINYLKEKNIQVMIHMPHKFGKETIDFTTKEKNVFENNKVLLEKLHKLVEDNYNVLGFVLHAFFMEKNQFVSDDENQLIYNLKVLRKYLVHAYLENLTENNLFSKPDSILRIIKEVPVKGICFDFAHYVKENGWNESEFKDLISKIDKPIYYHILNAEPSEFYYERGLKEGAIDFEKISDVIDFGVIEVYSEDEEIGKEMVEDYKQFQSIKEKQIFDRILMPLPKSAEDFLDVALSVSKQGTIVHFYDFLNESDFDQAYEKVRNACEKRNVEPEFLELVKCGQHAPHVFRICLDFKIK